MKTTLFKKNKDGHYGTEFVSKPIYIKQQHINLIRANRAVFVSKKACEEACVCTKAASLPRGCDKPGTPPPWWRCHPVENTACNTPGSIFVLTQSWSKHKSRCIGSLVKPNWLFSMLVPSCYFHGPTWTRLHRAGWGSTTKGVSLKMRWCIAILMNFWLCLHHPKPRASCIKLDPVLDLNLTWSQTYWRHLKSLLHKTCRWLTTIRLTWIVCHAVLHGPDFCDHDMSVYFERVLLEVWCSLQPFC